MTNTIDPDSFPTTHPLSVALRLTSRYWFLSYSKLMSMDWQWIDMPDCPFGATDGRTLYLNRSGLDKLCAMPNGSGLIAFLLVHEALHALLGHGWRLIPLKDKQTGNIAADYIVNAMIAMRNRELKREVFPFIDGVLLDEQLSGDKSVEQLYRQLVKPQPPAPQPEINPSPEPQPQDSNDQQDNDESDSDGDAPSEGDSDDDSDTDGGSTPSDSADGDHGDADPDGGADGSDQDGGDSGDGGSLKGFVGTGVGDNLEPALEEGESLSEAVSEIEETNERILVADEIDRRQSGEGGETGKRVKQHNLPVSTLDWADLLREWLVKHKRDGWKSPFNHVIYGTTGLVCAGRRSQAAGTIVLVLDSSGSIGSSTYTKFLQQAQSILDELKPEQLVLLSVSHRVADSVILEVGDTAPDRMSGGGGTRFQPAFDWLERNQIDPDVMVYLTDGWSEDLRDLKQPNFPLLWLSTCRESRDFKVGEVMQINDF